MKEFFKYIKKDILLSREKRAIKKRRESLIKFIDSPAGRKHLEDVIKEWNIQEVEEKEIIAIDNDDREWRLAISIEHNNFIDIVRDRKPNTFKYRITNQTDTSDAGDLLMDVDGKIAIQTFGIIFPHTNSVKGMYDEIADLYTPIIKEYRGFRPWKELTLNKQLGSPGNQ